jgi:hypothetical protein
VRAVRTVGLGDGLDQHFSICFAGVGPRETTKKS